MTPHTSYWPRRQGLNKLRLAPSPYYAKMADGTPIALIEVSESTARFCGVSAWWPSTRCGLARYRAKLYLLANMVVV